ncbi:MAG: SMC family ATPase [Actinomycetaceae bacterium]|nr:SMC family ATPase [Arcanobacterium sp.]MDD7687448.1 SMC family ATPase [Actinomycetaceae bacterium]
MLIRHLEFSGIGPFAGQHSIDFDELTASGVFLIEGPTGSGKSTIIDAIVFALYGDVAGTQSTDKRMRSSHADRTRESWVDMVFTVASGSYRVKRYPAQERAKKRGAGTVSIASSAKLWKLSEAALDQRDWEAGEPLASQARETSAMIADIVGMNKRQFVQTVVLPQGQFADFLRLNSKERATLLEKIFHTDDIRLFAEELRSRASDADADIATAFSHYSSALDAWLLNPGLSEQAHSAVQALRDEHLSSEHAHSSIPDSDGNDTPSYSDAPLLRFLKEEGATMKATAEREHTRLSHAREQESAARDALEAGKSLAAAIHQRAELRTQLAQLHEQEPEINRTETALKLHEATQVPLMRLRDFHTAFSHVRDVWHAYDSAPAQPEQIAAIRAMPDGSSLCTQLADLSLHELSDLYHRTIATASTSDDLSALSAAFTSPMEAAAAISDSLTESLSALGEILGSVRIAADVEAELHAQLDQADQWRHQLAHLNSQLETIRAEQEEIPAQHLLQSAALEQARAVAEQLATWQNERSRIAALQELSTKLASVQSARHDAESQLRDAISAHEHEKHSLDELTRRWIASTAANLAEDLAPDEPCPVCGSTEHPHVAMPTDEHVRREDVDNAQAELAQAARAVSTADATLSAAKIHEAELLAQIGEHTATSLDEEAESLDAQIDTAQKAQVTVQTIMAELSALDEHTQQLSLREADVREQRASCEANLATLTSTIATAQQKISAARGEYASVADHVSALEDIRDTAVELREHVTVLGSALQNAQTSLREATQALHDSPFSSFAAAQAAHMDYATRSDAQKSVEEYHSALDGVQARLAAPEIKRLTGEEYVDLDKLEADYSTASHERERAHDAATQAEFVADDAARLFDLVQSASQKWHTTARDAGPITRLASIATAGNASLTGIPLNIWALLKRFDVVVERANEHLEEISAGRYELIRVNESTGNKKAGLDLHVIDRQGSAAGDEERDTTSLSGGETFYTSLALALALAEVVQAEQGGIQIDTLLIDEGFGTLSDDVREAVMNTLTSLSRSGRVVGIVSHVEELKQLVPNRIALRQLPDGSSTLSVVA